MNMCLISSFLRSSKEYTWATAACPFELRIEVASHSKRSWFVELLGKTYPDAGSASAPYLCSLRHTPTRALAFAVGKVNTRRSQAAGFPFSAPFITNAVTIAPLLLRQIEIELRDPIPWRARKPAPPRR